VPFVTVLLLGSDSFVVSCACGPMSLQVVAHAGLS